MIDLFSLYLGINCRLHDLSISVPGDLSSRFGSWGSAGKVVWCVGLKTYNRAALHHRVWRRNCKAEQTYHSKQKNSLQLQASTEPQRSHTDIELRLLLAQHQYIATEKEANNIFVRPCVCLIRCSFRQEKRPRTVVLWKKDSTLFTSFLGTNIITLFALTVAKWCFNWIAYLFIYLHGFAHTTGKPSVPPLMKASISPTNKRRHKHGVCAGLSRSLHRTNFTVCIWIVRGPSAAAARTLMESEC